MERPNKSLPQLDTYYAPAARATREEFVRQQAAVEGMPLLREALNAMPHMVMILNAQRQIVIANDAALRTVHAAAADVLAKRPGEAVACIRAKEGPEGCGTAEHCATCGAVHAILESSRQNGQVVRECRIQVDTPDGVAPLDLKATATPITVDGEPLTVVVMEDISESKRLAVLQRVFFHDVLNTVGCISSCVYCLAGSRQLADDLCDLLGRLSKQLTEEIAGQRDLLAAETGELAVRIEPVQTRRLLEELRQQYGQSPLTDQRAIDMGAVWDGTIMTDRRLMARVVGNMLKNGLEATAAGQAVTLECHDRGPSVAIAVHNPDAMPAEVQQQVFQRSFSTKGQPGRGIGTYSMKLFGEQYLGGKVEFISVAPQGTTFTLTVPKKP